jgi:cytosine deaminase
MTSTFLRQATIVRGGVTERLVDVLIVDGVIASIGESLANRSAESNADESIDLAGHLLLPAAVEPHAHLDKAFLAERVENRSGDLVGAIDAMIKLAATITFDDTVERAERAARLMAANGYVAVRTHADTTEYVGVRSVEALVEVRRRVADVIDVEIVALTGSNVVGPHGANHRALLRDALAAGADLVGGCPHLEPDGTIEAATDVLLDIAVDVGVGVDLHTDETLDPEVMGLEYLAQQVLAGFPHRVTASHCVSLGQRSGAEQQRIAELVAAAGIGVITLPHTNLWLGGRNQQPVPRGLTAIDALRAAGVTVAAGADNLQDPFNPMGRACPFETASLMVLAAHDLPHLAWQAVSTDARQVLGRSAAASSAAGSSTAAGSTAAIAVGAVADLVVVPGDSLRGAIAEGPTGRRVFRAGHEVATP